MTQEPKFRSVLESWTKSALKAAIAREAYRKAYAEAWLKADGKTVDAKKYEAEQATSALRLSRDETAIFAESDKQELLFVRGAAAGSELPVALDE